jgi:CDP-diacylglycerol--glycerol-3-phosphate 3-phosphatidyltransferase
MLIPAFLRQGFEALLQPLVSRLVASDVQPNAITSVGTALLVAAGVFFGFGWVRVGAALLRVARQAGSSSDFGAFYDSTLDRVGESALLIGVAVFFVRGGVAEPWMVPAVVLTAIALSAGLIVSYARARAEGLGLDCKVGIAQRAERVLGLGVPTVLFGAGPGGLLLLSVVGLLAVVSAVTVVQRIHYVRKASGSVRRKTRPRWGDSAEPLLASSTRKGRSGD